MSIVALISALGALVPLVVDLVGGDVPGGPTLAGMALALGGASGRPQRRAGVAPGDRPARGGGDSASGVPRSWPKPPGRPALGAGGRALRIRSAALVAAGVVGAHPLARPPDPRLVVAAGVLDASANLMFATGSREGLVSVVVVLGSPRSGGHGSPRRRWCLHERSAACRRPVPRPPSSGDADPAGRAGAGGPRTAGRRTSLDRGGSSARSTTSPAAPTDGEREGHARPRHPTMPRPSTPTRARSSPSPGRSACRWKLRVTRSDGRGGRGEGERSGVVVDPTNPILPPPMSWRRSGRLARRLVDGRTWRSKVVGAAPSPTGPCWAPRIRAVAGGNPGRRRPPPSSASWWWPSATRSASPGRSRRGCVAPSGRSFAVGRWRAPRGGRERHPDGRRPPPGELRRRPRRRPARRRGGEHRRRRARRRGWAWPFPSTPPPGPSSPPSWATDACDGRTWASPAARGPLPPRCGSGYRSGDRHRGGRRSSRAAPRPPPACVRRT